MIMTLKLKFKCQGQSKLSRKIWFTLAQLFELWEDHLRIFIGSMGLVYYTTWMNLKNKPQVNQEDRWSKHTSYKFVILFNYMACAVTESNIAST